MSRTSEKAALAKCVMVAVAHEGFESSATFLKAIGRARAKTSRIVGLLARHLLGCPGVLDGLLLDLACVDYLQPLLAIWRAETVRVSGAKRTIHDVVFLGLC